MGKEMKTTIDPPDELLIEAKKQAASSRTTLRALIESGLRRELSEHRRPTRETPRPTIRWVTSPGGLPPGMDVSDRAAMHDKLRASR